MPIIRVLVVLAALGLTSFVGGVLAYVAALRVIFHETAGAGDFGAVIFWSAWLYAPFVPLVLWPGILVLSATYADTRRFLVFPLAGATAGFVPVVCFGAIWHAGTIVSPELLLFAVLFSTAGSLFGFGYAVAWKWVHE